ncbi:MAG: rhodanese-like domain-containing protein [Proteobacteria bacterium]|nr:rhodanese-like domain-containing protein [Pseudomonadota bacterium]
MSDQYAGDVTSKEAWEMLESDPRAVLLDVRTDAEWRYVGLPDLTVLEKRTLRVSWQEHPDLHFNPNFAQQVATNGVANDQTVLIICRSGVRSQHAAMALTARGYSRCYNVSDGFEGGHDEDRHRGAREGWKAAGLPWRQE